MIMEHTLWLSNKQCSAEAVTASKSKDAYELHTIKKWAIITCF